MISDIEIFCKLKGISFARFGTLVMKDPNFVFSLARIRSRTLNQDTIKKVRAWMDDNAQTDLRTDRDRQAGRAKDIDAAQLVEMNQMELFSQALLSAIWRSHKRILMCLANQGLNVVHSNGVSYVNARLGGPS